MSKEDLIKCGQWEKGDGCVVNYGGGREYWCQYADQDSLKEEPIGKNDEGYEESHLCAFVMCTKLNKRIPAAC